MKALKAEWKRHDSFHVTLRVNAHLIFHALQASCHSPCGFIICGLLVFAYHLIRVREQSILTIEEQSALKESLQCFLVQIPFETLASQIALEHGYEEAAIQSLFDTFANESPVTLDLILADLDVGHRMLEVGAGLCLTSLFLKQEGYPIVALEPALGGFGIFERVKDAILKYFSYLKLNVMIKPAQQLNIAESGQFDLIFSNNVMEHIPDWQAALDAMAAVLSQQGKMIHACPNYSIPYEPHYGTLVLRYYPDLCRRLFIPKEVDLGIWHSLNFITCRQIKQHCRHQKLHYRFQESLLYKALQRIDDDPLFKQRHQGMVASIATFIMRSGLGSIIKRIPATMATPMIVEISKEETDR